MTHWKWLSNHLKKEPPWTAATEIAPSKIHGDTVFFIKCALVTGNNKFSEYFFLIYIRMSGKSINFDNKNIKKSDFYKNKNCLK